jgi:hypothetical protein
MSQRRPLCARGSGTSADGPGIPGDPVPGTIGGNIMRKLLATLALTGFLVGASAMGAVAAPLPDNCTKDRGTVTCETFDGPGNNQAGVGTTETTETQGNTTNKSPEPQDLQDDCTWNPPTSQGAPNGC